jgi:hypothetical protein
LIDNQSDSGPAIVGVDGSERSVEALALADLLGPALGRRVVIAHVHPYRQLSSLFAQGEYERLESEVAESIFKQIRLLSGASAPVAVAPAGYATAGAGIQTVGRLRRFQRVASPPRLGDRTRKDDIGAPTRAQRLLGSVSSALVRSAQSPLVVVPRGADGE